MTGYAALDAEGRRWDIRSVNARGFDLRLRLPDAPAGLEPMVREAVAAVVARGNVTVSLRIGTGAEGLPSLNAAGLERALEAIETVEAAAAARGLAMTPATPAQILGLRGIWDSGDSAGDLTLRTARDEVATLLREFDADRAREGAGLHAVLAAQVAEIAALTQAATDLAPARAAHGAETFRAAVARLTDAASGAALDPDRVAQEIAALAVKSDITEELDRLRTHVAAAEALLATEGPVGRRLDFLTQEFNREANTLCSKAGMAELTAIGLDLKAVIDRLREQVQNVE